MMRNTLVSLLIISLLFSKSNDFKFSFFHYLIINAFLLELEAKYGFKKTYTGPYSDYSLGILNPIQQSYFIEYNSNHLQAAIGHFVTSSGIPDSSANGSLNDRIFNASILTKGLIRNWEWKLYGSQFNQKYSVDHSSWYNPSNQYLNRSIIQANIINQIKESIIIGFGFVIIFLISLFILFDELSITTIFKSASFDFPKAKDMPFFSTSFFTSLIPAVSETITG